MAEVIGITSGLLTLITFGLKASTSLYQTIHGFNSHQRNVRELREELEALTQVLASLNQAAKDSDTDFVALRLPLLRCGNACADFEAIIVKSAEHANGQRTSFRDWAKLKYLGDDINGFKNMLSGYKSTITIALCNANLRASAVTTSVLNEYQGKIEDTMSDLSEHLRDVDDRLQTLLINSSNISESETEWRNLQSEKESVQQCMSICNDVAVHVDSVRPKIVATSSAEHEQLLRTTDTSIGYTVRRDTDQVLGRCKDDLAQAISQLHNRLQDLSQRQQRLAYQHAAPLSKIYEQQKLQDEVDSIKQSLAICAEASEKAQPDRANIFEDVTMTDEGEQIMVSTFGELICARRVTAGARSIQWFGQMSDESLQQLSQGRAQTGNKSKG